MKRFEALAKQLEFCAKHKSYWSIDDKQLAVEAAIALRDHLPGRLDCGEIENELKKHLKIGGHDAWEGHYYFVDGIKAAAAAILALFPTLNSGAATEECANCRYFRLGECHLNPPSRLPRKFDSSANAGYRVRDEELIWGWPLTGPKNWCGQFLALPRAVDGEAVTRTKDDQ